MSNVTGRCLEMCPREEIIMRERERLLHPLEIASGTEKNKIPKADPNRIVKTYNRSAAGVDLTSPAQLRPPDVLYNTVKYLLSIALNDNRFSLLCKYHFITNRCRSISQDAVIQLLESNDCIKIYEPIVKFHTLCGYSLCDEKIDNYDPFLNNKQLTEYLKRLLLFYDELDKDSMLSEEMESLTIKCEKNAKIAKDDKANRLIIESIYILSNLGNTIPLLRYLSLPQKLKTSVYKLSFEIGKHFICGNFVKVCQLFKKLPTILLCAALLHLPALRRHAFRIMNVSYSSKSLTYPVDTFRDLLLYNNNAEVIKDCKFYNIATHDNKISFDKNTFKYHSEMIPPKKSDILDKRFSTEKYSDLILYI